MAHTVKFKGNPITLAGSPLKVGDKAPDATLHKSLVETMRLRDTSGRVRIISVVPSLDTPVCSIQTKRFNKETTSLPNVDIYTISVDLPPAQARFCGAEGIDRDRLHVLSDHKDVDFGTKFGTLIPDLRVECRAVFVLDKDDTIRHAEYVAEVTSEPNYEAALSCAKTLAG